jgi:hypothetical protein
MDEHSIYEITGGDYSIYALGYDEARKVANEAMRRDEWGGIPFVIKLDLDLRPAPNDDVRISMNDLDILLQKVSDPYPDPIED